MPVWKSWAGQAAVLVAIELPWLFLMRWAEGAFGLREGSVHILLQVAGIVLAVGLGRTLFPMPPRSTTE